MSACVSGVCSGSVVVHRGVGSAAYSGECEHFHGVDVGLYVCVSLSGCVCLDEGVVVVVSMVRLGVAS